MGSGTTERNCIYCGLVKPIGEFSDEHIWPDALGGDYLPSFWRTDDVCASCNSASGIFVDGAFIKGFFTSAERYFDSLDYLDPDKPGGILPLSYLGSIQEIATQEGETVDYWVCAPGANIFHFRKADEEVVWRSYAGGDPRRQSKKSKAGRVLIALTSAEPYWIITSLLSVRNHFSKADKFIVNMDIPAGSTHFKVIDAADAQQADDLRFFKEFEDKSRVGRIRITAIIPLLSEGRFLAKLGLAVGYKLFGTNFLASEAGTQLRRAFREANPTKRKAIPIKGNGYINGADIGKLQEKLRWPGAWVLILWYQRDSLLLIVQSPSGHHLSIQITKDHEFLQTLDPNYRDGVIWLTAPMAGRAVGPLPYPDYLAHQIGALEIPSLRELEKLRGTKDRLPPTGIPEKPDLG